MLSKEKKLLALFLLKNPGIRHRAEWQGEILRGALQKLGA
jgi:hypothetical protein